MRTASGRPLLGVGAPDESTAPRWRPHAAHLGAVGLVLAVTVAVLMGWDSGGYFPPSYLRGGAVVFGLLGVLMIFETRPPWTLTTHAVLAVGGLAALTAWTGAATTWSSSPEDGLLLMLRDLAYLGLFGLAAYSLGSGRSSRVLTGAVLAGALAMVFAGLVSRLDPALIPTSAFELRFASYRLDYPVSYWNGYGALAAMAVILCVGFAASPRLAPLVRVACAAAAVPAATGLYLSLSRGGFLALAVGLIVWSILTPHRVWALFGVALVGACSALAIVRVSAYPALVISPRAGAGEASAGRVFAVQLLGAIALAAFGQWAAIQLQARVRLQSQWRRALVRGLSGAALLLVLAAVGGYAIAGAGVDRDLGLAGAWIDGQWSDFLHSTVPATGPARLTSGGGSRVDVYRVALDGFARHAVRGEGSGSFVATWIRERPSDQFVQNAHSLFLETLDELGLVGILLLIVFLAAVVSAGVRASRRAGGLSRGEAAAVTAAFTVWVVHSAVDWDWQLSGVTGLALLLGAVLLPSGQRRRTRAERSAGSGASPATGGLSRRALVTTGLGCLLCAVLFVRYLPAEQRLDSATRLAAAGQLGPAAAALASISSEPTVGRAEVLNASLAEAAGLTARAITLLRLASAHRPNDWSVRAALAEALARSGRRGAARAQLRLAVGLNPRLRPARTECATLGTAPGC